MFTLRRIKFTIYLVRFIGRHAMLYSRFCQRMYRQPFSFRNTCNFKHQCRSAMSYHQFIGLRKLPDYIEQHDIIFLRSMLGKYRYGITTRKDKSIEIVGMPFEMSYRIIGFYDNPRIRSYIYCIRYSIYFLFDFVFIKSFQILEQAKSVYRIHRQNSNSFRHKT